MAQVANVDGGRQVALNAVQKEEAIKTVPLEVKADVKHYEGKGWPGLIMHLLVW